MKNNLINILFKDKPLKILLKIDSMTNKKYASVIAKETHCTYSHTVKIIHLFEKEGIIRFVNNGRVKTIELTEKGKNAIKIIKKLFTLLND